MIASTVESKYSLAKMRLEKGQGTVENSLSKFYVTVILLDSLFYDFDILNLSKMILLVSMLKVVWPTRTDNMLLPAKSNRQDIPNFPISPYRVSN